MMQDQIVIKSSNLELIMHVPKTQHGVVEYINNFNQLWFGQIHPIIFKNYFNNQKSKITELLVNLNTIEDNDDYRIGHKLDLCHQALQSKWHSPATATIINQTIHWESGLSRMLAGGMAWPNPWLHHNLLLLGDNHSADHHMVNHTEITSDSTLSELLGLTHTNQLSTRVEKNNNQLNFRLGAVKKITGARDYLIPLSDRVDTLRSWMTKYPQGSRLNVYTDDPTRIVDTAKFWDIHHAGPGPKHNTLTGIDTQLYNRTKLNTTGIHEFYVQNSTQTVDVAELLFWMDLKYTSFITQDWQYALLRPCGKHYVKTIGLSRDNTFQ